MQFSPIIQWHAKVHQPIKSVANTSSPRRSRQLIDRMSLMPRPASRRQNTQPPLAYTQAPSHPFQRHLIPHSTIHEAALSKKIAFDSSHNTYLAPRRIRSHMRWLWSTQVRALKGGDADTASGLHIAEPAASFAADYKNVIGCYWSAMRKGGGRGASTEEGAVAHVTTRRYQRCWAAPSLISVTMMGEENFGGFG